MASAYWGQERALYSGLLLVGTGIAMRGLMEVYAHDTATQAINSSEFRVVADIGACDGLHQLPGQSVGIASGESHGRDGITHDHTERPGMQVVGTHGEQLVGSHEGHRD